MGTEEILTGTEHHHQLRSVAIFLVLHYFMNGENECGSLA
jgi:hypothetical protein